MRLNTVISLGVLTKIFFLLNFEFVVRMFVLNWKVSPRTVGLRSERAGSFENTKINAILFMFAGKIYAGEKSLSSK